MWGFAVVELLDMLDCPDLRGSHLLCGLSDSAALLWDSLDLSDSVDDVRSTLPACLGCLCKCACISLL